MLGTFAILFIFDSAKIESLFVKVSRKLDIMNHYCILSGFAHPRCPKGCCCFPECRPLALLLVVVVVVVVVVAVAVAVAVVVVVVVVTSVVCSFFFSLVVAKNR